MRKRSAYLALLSGIAAPIVYMGATLGAVLPDPRYSLLADTVSALLAGNAAGPALYGALYTYNLLVLLFGLTLAAHAWGQDNALIISGIAVVAVAVLGVLTLIFPADPPREQLSNPGLINIWATGFCVLGSMVAITASTYGWRGRRSVRLRTFLSWGALGLVAISGTTATLSVAAPTPLTGALERTAIGTFLVWMAAVGLTLWLDVRREAKQFSAPASAVRPSVRASLRHRIPRPSANPARSPIP